MPHSPQHISLQINILLGHVHDNMTIFFFLWNCFTKKYIKDVSALINLRQRQEGKVTLNITVVLMSALVICITGLDWHNFRSMTDYNALAQRLKNSSYSVLSNDGFVLVLIKWMTEIVDLWFKLCSLAFVVYTAAMCINLQDEFEKLERDFRVLTKSGELYANGAFAEWRKKFEEVVCLVESLNASIGPYLCFDILYLSYSLLAIIYNVLQTCDPKLLHLFNYIPQFLIPLLMLVLSAVNVNEKVN